MLRPTSLVAATSLARLQEEKGMATRRMYKFDNPRLGTVNNPTAVKSNGFPIMKITSAEMKEKRDKGLIYYCDEKYSLGHKCKTHDWIYLKE